MDNKKIFCDECREYSNYTIKNISVEDTIKGRKYTYEGKRAFCDCCGSEVFVDEVMDFNLKAMYDEYRRKNDIISLEDIKEIPKKYDIGKRPLSLLLGWGEQTFSRYLDGYIPSKEYSDTLKRIYNDPNYYNIILEENKSNLKSNRAYSNSKKAVMSILDPSENNEFKLNEAANFLVNICEDVTPLALQKALYYVQGFHYAFYGHFFFEEDCQAWIHGPVYANIYQKYKDYKYDSIETIEQSYDHLFTSSELAILESVARNICCYSGKVLEKFTHSETPWIIARGDLKDMEPSNKIIDKEDIKNYFMKVKEKHNMIIPADIESYARAMFEKLNL